LAPHGGDFTHWPLYSRERMLIPIEYEAGWAPELIWMVLEMGKSLEDPHKQKKEVCHLFLQIQASEKPYT